MCLNMSTGLKASLTSGAFICACSFSASKPVLIAVIISRASTKYCLSIVVPDSNQESSLLSWTNLGSLQYSKIVFQL